MLLKYKDDKCFLEVFVFSKLPESDFPSTHNSQYSPIAVVAGTIEILIVQKIKKNS